MISRSCLLFNFCDCANIHNSWISILWQYVFVLCYSYIHLLIRAQQWYIHYNCR